MSHTPSKYQQAIYNQFVTTNKNILISAGPGAGKTSVLVEMAKLIPYGKKAIFIAFNKSIVNELKERLPESMVCSTMHSLGYRSIISHYSHGASLNDNKQIKYIEPLCDKEGRDVRQKWSMIYQVDKIMRLVRATMTENKKEEISNLCDEHAIECGDEHISIVSRALRKFYAYNDESRSEFMSDYTDMIEHCVRSKEIRLPQYDLILGDEIQDFSNMDKLFILKMKKPVTGRHILVGDINQSIYNFRGAAMDSFNAFGQLPNTIIMPLSISYRLPKSGVKEANKIYNEVEAFEGNEEGVVRKGKINEIQEGDMVICRNSAPLIDVFLKLIGEGKKAYIVGKEMEQGLLGILSSLDPSASTDIWGEFQQREKEKIVNELQAKGIKNPLNHPKYGIFIEKISILRMLFEKFAYIYEIEEFIKEIFDEDEEREGVKLQTIHKAKGGESDRVFVIEKYEGNELIPSKYAITDSQK